MCDEEKECEDSPEEAAERLAIGKALMMRMLSMMYTVAEAYTIALMLERDLRLAGETAKDERSVRWLKDFALARDAVKAGEATMRETYARNAPIIEQEMNQRKEAT